MERQPARRSGLFLMELIIAILFFSLASTVCVKLFVKSHTLEQESVNLNHAVNVASSVAEIFRSQEDFYKYLGEQFPNGEKTEGSYCFFYDDSRKLCGSSNAAFTVTLSTEDDDAFLIGTITVTKNDDTLYDLTVKKYIQRRASL